MRPRALLAAEIVAPVLTAGLFVASLAAVWLDGGVRFFEWGAALGPLCVVVAVYDIWVVAWTITWERNRAVAEFGDRKEGGS